MILIRFDECISWRTVDALNALKLPPDITLESSNHQQQNGMADVSWIEDFAARDGKLIVSGDTNMRRVALERAALEAAGLVAVFPGSKKFFDSLGRYGQTGYLIRWFPVIERLAREATPGSHFRLPASFTAEFESVSELKSLAEIDADRREEDS